MCVGFTSEGQEPGAVGIRDRESMFTLLSFAVDRVGQQQLGQLQHVARRRHLACWRAETMVGFIVSAWRDQCDAAPAA
jgi:hypothetical protein